MYNNGNKNKELNLDTVKIVQDNYVEKKASREKKLAEEEKQAKEDKNKSKTFVNKGKPLKERKKKLPLSIKLAILGALAAAGITAVTLDYMSFDKTAERLENSQEENSNNLDEINIASTKVKIAESEDRNLDLEQKAFNIKLNDVISQYQKNPDSITSEQLLDLLKEGNDISHDIITTTVFDAYKEANGDAPINSVETLVTLPPSHDEGSDFRVAYENKDINYGQVGKHISITPNNIPYLLSKSIEYQLQLEALLKDTENLDVKDTLKAIMNTTIKTNELSNTSIKYENGKIVEDKDATKDSKRDDLEADLEVQNSKKPLSDKDDDFEL